MKRPIIIATAVAALAIMTIAGTAGQSAAGQSPARGTAAAPLAGSAAAFTASAPAAGAVPGSRRLTVQLWLRPRVAAAEKYAAAVSTPGGRLFHHYLSPAGYTARFGATRAEANGLASWLRSSGFTGVRASSQREYVQATAPVSTISTAFKTSLKYYQATGKASAGRYPLRANDKPVTLPARLAGNVAGVTGLDNAALITTHLRARNPAEHKTSRLAKRASFPCSAWYGQHYARNLPKIFGAAAFPTIMCGYSAGQLRAAYGYSARNTGRGQTIALIEVGLTQDMFLTLRDYAAANKIQAPSVERYQELSLGRGSQCGDPFDIEEQLDVEAAYTMAPAARDLVVGGDSCDTGYSGLQSVFDADTAVLDGAGGHPLASVASNSWELNGGESQPADYLDIMHASLLRAASEGVGMYFASGDSSGVETPSTDPYAIAVGGTTLGIGNKNPRLFETGWSTAAYEASGSQWYLDGQQGAAGGGPSMLWAQPSYQRGVVPSALARAPGDRGGLVRAVPDISSDADPDTGMAVGTLTFDAQGNPAGYTETSYGGTSVATPTVAGLVTAAEQGQGHSFGFINPALYRLAGTPAVHDALPVTGKTPSRYRAVACDAITCGLLTLSQFDDENAAVDSGFGAPYTGQVTRKGYDTMTGIGTPAGQRFIAGLRRLEG
jgi:subtilase family serine protease